MWLCAAWGQSFEKLADGEAGAHAASSGREMVYELYLKYEAWKEMLGAYDVMDACYAVHTSDSQIDRTPRCV